MMAAARNNSSFILTKVPFHFISKPCVRQAQPLLSSCKRYFNNTTPSIEADALPPDPLVQTPQPNVAQSLRSPSTSTSNDTFPRSAQSRSELTTKSRSHPAHSPRYELDRAPTAPVRFPTTPLKLTSSLREYIPYLKSQPPYYVTIHIHGKPYLVTEGDSVRLPFLMHGVMPGDILRLDRASYLGSREWTLRAGSSTSDMPAPSASALGPQDAFPKSKDKAIDGGGSPESLTVAEPVVGRTFDLPSSPMNMHQNDPSTSQLKSQRPKRRNKPSYLDPRLFVCRATVLGTESEPMRVLEKTKQRQRRVKHVHSRMRYTVLRIGEISVKSVEDLEREAQGTIS